MYPRHHLRAAPAMAAALPLLGVALLAAAPPCGAASPLLLPSTGGAAPRSGLPGFDTWEMPDGALRLTEAAEVRELTDKLKAYAAESGLTLRATEAICWMNQGRDDYHNADTETALRATFQGAGFTVRESGGPGDVGYRFT